MTTAFSSLSALSAQVGQAHMFLAQDDASVAVASPVQLVIAAVASIFSIIILIVWLKMHPFLALMLGSGLLAVIAGIPFLEMFTSFSEGLGKTVGGVGVLIALGAIIGALLVKSGASDAIVDGFLARTPNKALPWTMAALAFIIGIPLFFEVGVVLLIPVVMIVAQRTKKPIILLGIPALAGLSVLHALVPPHPGPLVAVDALGANLGITLGLGLLAAIPVVIISGPLIAGTMAKWVPIGVPRAFVEEERVPEDERPGFWLSLSVILMPVFLMLLRTVVEATVGEEPGNVLGTLVIFLGTPMVALLTTVLYGIAVLGLRGGRGLKDVSDLVGSAFAPIAGILLIVGAGGGFKETLVDSGVADVIADWISGAPLSPLVAGWIVAVLIRLATGSATVATVTAAGIMAPIAPNLEPTHLALLVLAIGAGSVFFSHVNDAGFWLVKEYFGMTVPQTFKTWSLMETVVSVTGLAVVMLLSLIV